MNGIKSKFKKMGIRVPMSMSKKYEQVKYIGERKS